MRIPEYLEKIQKIYNSLLDFLANEADIEEKYQNFSNIIGDYNFFNDKHDLILFLRMISHISTNHPRGPNFISKIEKILQSFQNDIQKNLTNSEIYTLFNDNKRILLFLIESSIITLDENIVKDFFTTKNKKAKYQQYFSPEIEPFINDQEFITKYDIKMNEEEEVSRKVSRKKNKKSKSVKKKKLPEDFFEKRKIGENDNVICDLIRNDSIKEFIVYVNNDALKNSNAFVNF